MRSIYGYKEKVSGLFWYVGQSINPTKRHTTHKHPVKRTNRPRFDNVISIRPNDFEMVILMDRIPTSDETNYWENYFIISKKSWYGFGAHGHNFEFAKVQPTPVEIETLRRAKISRSSTGRRPSAETRAKMSASRMGWVPSEITRKKLRVFNLGKPGSNLGKKASPETRAKQSAAHMGQKRGPFSIEHRARISESRKLGEFLKTVAWG